MPPFGLTVTVNLLAKSLGVFSHSRFSRIFSANVNPVKYLTSQTSGPPKRPLNGYMRYLLQQKPIVTGQNPEIKHLDAIRKIAQQWTLLSPEQKQPFQEASHQAMEQFKVDLQKYKAQQTPAQLQQQALEQKTRRRKRTAIRKKRELTTLGKPKRPRTAFNIYVSEHFQEARGSTSQAKMKFLLEDWKSLLSDHKKVYTQLAEDDKIRYKNEMESWEDHMEEIGREDLIRGQTLHTKKPRAKIKQVKKEKKQTKLKTAKKATQTSEASKKAKPRSSAQAVPKGSVRES
ncbi:transcription factor A, mitochondrial [Nothobranchius furzeri]|uniref:Transcription factor A, mitochondrial n=1 Tax=Nothobranchius furzeri TaxID=105023 RepID=A0A1A7ZEL2_NOTFU|nr:mitochondrial [Nothobranchius furzeri]